MILGGVSPAYSPRQPWRIGITMGQSNAGSSGGDSTLDAATRFSARCFMPSPNAWPYGDAAVGSSGYTLTSLVATTDNGIVNGNQCVATMDEFAAAQFDVDYGDVLTAQNYVNRFHFTTWRGGTALGGFLPSTAPDYISGNYAYANLLTYLGLAAGKIAAQGNIGVCDFITFIQGESGPSSGWGTMFTTEFFANIGPDVKAATGQSSTPEVLLCQINSANDATTGNAVPTDQLSVGNSLYGQGLTLVGPMYAYPLADQGAGSIHLSSIGRMMHGECIALVKRIRAAGELFKPLQITSWSRTAATIKVNYNKPVAIDTDWIAAITNYGFSFTYGGSAKTISSVTVTGEQEITIVLAANPGAPGTETLRYAMDGLSNTTLWAACRGQIYSPTTIASPFYRWGFSVPQYVRHYAVRQIA